MSYLILRASPAFIFVLYLFVNLPDLLSANCEWLKKLQSIMKRFSLMRLSQPLSMGTLKDLSPHRTKQNAKISSGFSLFLDLVKK